MAAIDTILKSRLSTPALNRWCKGFTNVLNFAKAKNVPLVGIWSNGEQCGHCIMLESCLVAKPFKTWMATSNCVFYFGCRSDTSAEDKYEGKGFTWCRGADQQTTAFPFVRVYWKSGKVDWAGYGDQLDDNKDSTAGSKNVVNKLKSILKNFDPSSINKDDIKLLSGKNSCTSKTDSDVVDNKDNLAIRSFWLNNLLQKKDYPSDPEGYCFNGWSSHSSNGSFGKDKGPAYGDKSAFSKIKALAEQNGRPLFMIYGKANNKGTCFFNAGFNQGQRSSGSGNKFSRCQEGTFDPNFNVGNFGFYFVYYFNDKDETCAEANEVKQFIAQFGSIPTGYPWYCAYCKYPDKHIYARYGSLNSKNVLAGNQSARESAYNDAFLPNMDLVRSIGQEIQYVWTGGHQEDEVQYQTFQISFDLDGGTGQLQPLEVKTASDQGYVGSAILPSKTQVKAAVSKIGYELSCFVDDFGNECRFGSEFIIAADTVLTVVWTKVEKNESSEHQKPSAKRGQIRSYSTSQFPVWYKYGSTGVKTAQFSSNISALQVIGEASGGPSRNPATQQLVEVYFNDQTSEIAPSAFMQCQNLAYVDARSIKSVGDYAFYNCKSLTAADFIGAQNKALTHIGDYAFAGSGIRDLVINLQGSVSDSSTNTHCFANCRELTSVNITNSTYLADHMFDGCSQLQSVTLNNYHSYINNYAFANCTMLTSMTFPQKTYMLPDHLFDGCTNLREVKFAEPSDLKYLGEAVFANCPKLTSITLPKSIDSLDYIDPLFLSGSSINRVVFSGISDDMFLDEVQKEITVNFSPHTWYSSPGSTVKSILNTCHQKHLPMVINLGNGKGNCGNCATWERCVTQAEAWKKWFPSSKYYYIHGMYTDAYDGYEEVKKFIKSNTSLGVPGYFPYVYLYWNKLNDDGTTTKIALGSNDSATYNKTWGYAGALISLIDKTFAGFTGTDATYVIKPEITTFGRGEGVKVVYVSSTGKEHVCINDSVVYVPETRVDHYTTSNFKYGIWYRNIRELRQFADQTHQPLLLEFGSKGCDPCKDFKINTFNNQDFQDAVAAKPCLLAKVEIGDGESFDYPTDTQEFYASHEIGDPKTYIPQLVYYWSKSDGSTYKEIWNYNYRSDPGNANYQTVLAKLDKMLGGYTGDPQYLAPAIVSYLDGKYRYYQSEDGDESGQFFICDKKDIALSSTTQLSIVLSQATMDAGSTLVLNSIAPGDELVLGSLSAQDGAYQYFTVDSKSRYFDLSGVIFTVKDSTVTSLYTFENEIGSNYSSDQEHDDTGFWIKFNDTSTSEAFEAKLESCQGSSTPMLVFERPSTVGATAVFAPVSGGDSQTQTFQIDIEEAKSQNDIEAIVRDAIGSGNALQSISNIDELRSIQTFNTQVKHNAAFLTWAKKKNLVLVDVASSTWSGGAPARVRQFETEVQFHNNTTSDPLPKMLVYHGCSTCTVDGSIAVYTRRKVEVDSSKSLSYYTGLIGEYLDELEVN